jgi:glycosyltransferase involved in cell wall biosynthesis
MRIAFNLHALTGSFTGVQQTMRTLLESLCREAPEAQFLAYAPWGFDRSLLPEAENLTVRGSWARQGNRTLRILWEQFALYRRAGRDGAGLLHAPCYVMPVWSTVPVLVNVHDILAFTRPELCTAANRSHFRRFLPKTLERAARVVVPSSAVKREIIDTFQDLPHEKIRVLPWGVEPAFAPVADEAKRRGVALRYGLPPAYILHVGRREPKKNIRQVIEAYFSARATMKIPHRLVLAGPEGWGTRELDKIVRELGLEEMVLRLGYVPREDLPAIYSMASALVFPSLAEGFGLPVVEAMACGTPVIASDIPALREVADTAARLVAPGALPELRLALEELLTDEALAEEHARRGLERAREFSWAEHARRTVRLYREILGE